MKQPLLFSGMVCFLLVSGCLGFVTDEEIQTNLNVDVNERLLVIETVYEQGERISSSTVRFDLDFSGSTSDVSIQTFGIITDDGRSISVDADEQQIISLDYEHHGMYTVSLYAIDSTGTEVTDTIVLIVEQIITWTEDDTGSPESLFFDAEPGNNGVSPSYFVLNSTVSNPSPLLEIDGRDVDIEWAVINVDGQCTGYRDIVENGDSVTWNTLHFTPVKMHEIEMTIHDGQDEVNVEHVVALRYTE
jgi:hypothetical protein